MTSTYKIPHSATIRLTPVRRMYIAALLERGLSGDTAEEVIETVFCRGLVDCVPAEVMRNAVERVKAAERRPENAIKYEEMDFSPKARMRHIKWLAGMTRKQLLEYAERKMMPNIVMLDQWRAARKIMKARKE